MMPVILPDAAKAILRTWADDFEAAGQPQQAAFFARLAEWPAGRFLDDADAESLAAACLARIRAGGDLAGEARRVLTLAGVKH